jgi:hypothetical protein
MFAPLARRKETNAMPKLDPKQLQSRLRFDWTIAQKMNGPIVSVQAFKGLGDLSGRKDPIVKEEAAHRACVYSIEYQVRSLVGEAKYHDRFEISVDLLSGGNYPYSQPGCFVTSKPVPWSPHFSPHSGAICLGELWTEAVGTMTLGHLIVHLARLLNFDEPDREPSYGGWNPEATKYWRTVLKCQPITPGLVYPTLPAEVTHGIEILHKPLFRPAAAAGVRALQSHFRPAGK